MAPINPIGSKWVSKRLSWWERTFGPKCTFCNIRMKELEHPYEPIWHCERCDLFMIHVPKRKNNESIL